MHSEKYIRVTHQIHAIEQLSVKLRANDLHIPAGRNVRHDLILIYQRTASWYSPGC